MTAPVYDDVHEVDGMTRQDIEKLAGRPHLIGFDNDDGKDEHNEITKLAGIVLKVWDARDSARNTAAMQDEAIHKALPRTHVLEKIAKAAKNDWKTPNGEACNCQMRIGNPMVSSHSAGCKRMKELLVELDKVSG